MVSRAFRRFMIFAEENFRDLVIGLMIAGIVSAFSGLLGAGFWAYHVQIDVAEIRNQAEDFPKSIDGLKEDLKQLLAEHGQHLARIDDRLTDHAARLGNVEGRISSQK